MSPELYLQFWGKAERPPGLEWHPVAYHCLDVAAVADVLLRVNPRRLRRMATLLGTEPDAARSFLVKLIALHDIGKFSTGFQSKVPGLYPKHLKPHAGSSATRHDEIAWLLREVVESHLCAQLKGWGGDFEAIWGSVAGHHGKPQAGDPRDNPVGMTTLPSKAMNAFIADCLALFPDQTPLRRRTPAELATLSWAVAGLAVLADWIGSSRDWFPYRAPEQSLAEYWDYARSQAQVAVAEAGVLPSAVPAQISAARLLPAHIAEQLSPLQSFATTVDLANGPTLAIIEDVTGSGKTEAALLLAARLLAAGNASGIFIALPTMATANAMYDRLGGIYRKLFDDDETPSLVLAHGRTALHEGFTDSILISTAETSARTSDEEATGDESSAACAAWIADSRRKAFLADVGVGTIDQALLCVLPSKFQSLRLWGLADRVLVIDEAHAYDAYMSKEIETLLEFHAALGGSAIILSATLPHAQRQSLAAAFGRGLSAKIKTEETAAYPLATIVSQAACMQYPLETRADRTRTLPVRRITSPDEAVAHILNVSAKGGAVAWIRNSVDDAIEAVNALRVRGLDPILLHARFAMGHRLEIERRVTTTLGRPNPKIDQSKRQGFVLVGTQILEQSLDYDVDAMITDLAPIDLMIQRAGRLWRHLDRTGRPLSAPELLVLSPDPAQVLDANWYGRVSRRAARVYDHHGIVWRSANALFKAGAIETPSGVRGLVEAVYGQALDENDIPDKLRHRANTAAGDSSAARTFANANLLKFGKGYSGAENQTLWTSEKITPTRLGEPVTVFRLGRLDGKTIVPLCTADDGNPRLSWALSEVGIAQYRATGVPDSEPLMAPLIERAKASWSKWEEELPLLLLRPDGTAWTGTVTKGSITELSVRYDDKLGFRST